MDWQVTGRSYASLTRHMESGANRQWHVKRRDGTKLMARLQTWEVCDDVVSISHSLAISSTGLSSTSLRGRERAKLQKHCTSATKHSMASEKTLASASPHASTEGANVCGADCLLAMFCEDEAGVIEASAVLTLARKGCELAPRFPEASC